MSILQRCMPIYIYEYVCTYVCLHINMHSTPILIKFGIIEIANNYEIKYSG